MKTPRRTKQTATLISAIGPGNGDGHDGEPTEPEVDFFIESPFGSFDIHVNGGFHYQPTERFSIVRRKRERSDARD